VTQEEARAMCLEFAMDVYRNGDIAWTDIESLASSFEAFILTGGIIVRVTGQK
jgi:hypothetical protein